MAVVSQKTPPLPVEKGSLLRRGSHSKKPLKEKIVQIYEAFFRVSVLAIIVHFIIIYNQDQ